jgi:signal transduction histidine kinase
MSLRWNLVWLVLAAVVPVLLFSGGMIVKVADQQRTIRQQDIAETAGALAHNIDTQLRETIAVLEVLGLSNALASNDLKRFDALARKVLAGQPRWANIQLLGPAGEHLVNLHVPFGQPLPPLERPDFFIGTARSGRPQVSDMAPAAIVGRPPLTVVAVPVVRDGSVPYVLAAAIDASNWETFLQGRMPTGMGAFLVDRELTIISRTVQGERFAGKKPAPAFVEAIAREPEAGLLRGATLDGVDAYGAYRKLPFSGWTVAVFMPVAAVEAPVRASLVALAVGFLLLLALSLALAWIFGHRIASSMQRLAASVRSVGGGADPLPFNARITEVREASEALQDASTLLAERLSREQAARAELEAADRAKDEYLTMLGHELRNPLAPISASLFILEQEALASEPARRALAVIGRQTEHMGRLVDDLLDVTRIATGRVALQREPVDLGQILRRAAEDHAEIAAKAGIDLAVDIPAEPVRVNGDPTRLAQIVGNLAQNAVRFTPPGGRITLALARRDDMAEIRVVDTGVGIEAELLDRLFEPFVQGGQAGARTRGGLGLGLSLVKGLAELHGGMARASSAGPGKGAEFVVSLRAIE